MGHCYRISQLLVVFFLYSCVTTDSNRMVVNNFSQLPQSTQALIIAINKEDVDGVKYTLNSGPELDPICGFNMMCKPLAWAVETSNIEIVKLLVEAGADPNGQNAYDDTPLIYSLMSRKNTEKEFGTKPKEVMTYLINNGADVNQANAFGRSPFMSFCVVGDMDLISLSLSQGADVNAVHKAYVTADVVDLITPLMEAVRGGKAEVVELLLSKGADTNIRNSEGKTALDLATEMGHEAIVKILQAR